MPIREKNKTTIGNWKRKPNGIVSLNKNVKYSCIPMVCCISKSFDKFIMNLMTYGNSKKYEKDNPARNNKNEYGI